MIEIDMAIALGPPSSCNIHTMNKHVHIPGNQFPFRLMKTILFVGGQRGLFNFFVDTHLEALVVHVYFNSH